MNTVNVRKVEIGKGIPKICVLSELRETILLTQLVKRKKRRILWNGAQIGMKMFWILKRQKR